MKQNKLSVPTKNVEADLLVELTISNIPSNLLLDFLQKIVKPYYSGSLCRATEDLMQKAIAEQEFVFAHTRKFSLI
jgi:hypothetical protein